MELLLQRYLSKPMATTTFPSFLLLFVGKREEVKSYSTIAQGTAITQDNASERAFPCFHTYLETIRLSEIKLTRLGTFLRTCE